MLEELDDYANSWFIEKETSPFFEKSDRMPCSRFVKKTDATFGDEFLSEVPRKQDFMGLAGTPRWKISFEELEEFVKQFRIFNKHGRILATNYYIPTF